MTTKTKKPKAHDTYLAFIRQFPLVSIRSDTQLKRAQRVVDNLLQQRLDKGGTMYLDALGDLISHYEDEHHPVQRASQAELLRHLIEAKGLRQSDVSRDTHIAASTISEILSGKRSLNISHMEKLASYFHVVPGVFLGTIAKTA